MSAYVCVCVFVCVLIFLLPLGDLCRINTDFVGTNSPHEDHSLVLMRQNVLSEVLFKVRGKV